jgi:hypothetical protein
MSTPNLVSLECNHCHATNTALPWVPLFEKRQFQCLSCRRFNTVVGAVQMTEGANAKPDEPFDDVIVVEVFASNGPVSAF